MNDNAHDRLINGTGLLNTYIGYRLQRCSWDFLKEKFQKCFGDNWKMELESHHCELFNNFEHLIVMNNEKRLEFEFYSVENVGTGILVKERTLIEEEQKQFVLTMEYQSLPIKKYEINCFSAFKPSVFKKVAKFDYDFAFALKGEYAHILYCSEKDVFYHVKEHEVNEITRDQIIIPDDEMFFWDHFDRLLKKYVLSSITENNTPNSLRIIANVFEEYDNSVHKPDCFGLEKLLEFDKYDRWSEYCFEDSIRTVVNEVLREVF